MRSTGKLFELNILILKYSVEVKLSFATKRKTQIKDYIKRWAQKHIWRETDWNRTNDHVFVIFHVTRTFNLFALSILLSIQSFVQLQLHLWCHKGEQIVSRQKKCTYIRIITFSFGTTFDDDTEFFAFKISKNIIFGSVALTRLITITITNKMVRCLTMVEWNLISN